MRDLRVSVEEGPEAPQVVPADASAALDLDGHETPAALQDEVHLAPAWVRQ